MTILSRLPNILIPKINNSTPTISNKLSSTLIPKVNNLTSNLTTSNDEEILFLPRKEKTKRESFLLGVKQQIEGKVNIKVSKGPKKVAKEEHRDKGRGKINEASSSKKLELIPFH